MDKAQTGLWDSINPDEKMKDKIEFKLNETHTVTFSEDFERPEERMSTYRDGEPYCVFHVKENNEDKVIMTSAFTLLQGLKKLTPLKGKIVLITKKMLDGKNFFEVTEHINPDSSTG